MLAVVFVLLLTLNSQHSDQLIYGYTRGEPFLFLVSPIDLLDTNSHMAYLDAEAALYFKAMARFASACNVDIQVTYAYRTWKQQDKLWLSEPNLAAMPGFSDHQSGLSVDIKGAIGKRNKKTQLYYWLVKYAPLFGFYNDIKSEPWHWTFLGPPIITQEHGTKDD